MADFKEHLKKGFWTECEVIAVVGGAVLANQLFTDERIFAGHFKENPEWFKDDRAGAPPYIKFAPAIKAGIAVTASTYVDNPWLKLGLMGVAFQETLRQGRILTFKDGKSKIHKVGDANQTELDAQMKQLAEQTRTATPEFLGDAGTMYETNVATPEYLGDAGNQYETNVAGNEFMGDMDEMGGGFSHVSDDNTQGI
jgi:hypothetical protein